MATEAWAAGVGDDECVRSDRRDKEYEVVFL
jgi:hypothetical protein